MWKECLFKQDCFSFDHNWRCQKQRWNWVYFQVALTIYCVTLSKQITPCDFSKCNDLTGWTSCSLYLICSHSLQLLLLYFSVVLIWRTLETSLPYIPKELENLLLPAIIILCLFFLLLSFHGECFGLVVSKVQGWNWSWTQHGCSGWSGRVQSFLLNPSLFPERRDPWNDWLLQLQ